MNGDPKKNRIEAYARLREQNLITFDDKEMEQLMSEEENRASFHRFLLEKDATDFPDFNQWESKFFSDKKKVPLSPDAGEPSLDGSSGTSKPIEEAPESVDIRTVLESQGVTFQSRGKQLATMPVELSTEPQDETLSQDEPLSLIKTIVEPAPLQAAPMDVPLYSSMLETRKARKDATITKIKESPPEALENPLTGYDVLVADDDNKKLHGDPNTSDWTKGLLKARTFEDAADAVTERMGFIEAAIPGDVMDRYSTVKAALIEISETGQLEGNQAARQLFDEYSQILEENPGLAEYDELNAKAYSISQGYQNIRNTNPTYFTDIDRRKLMQDYADFKDKEKPKFVASVQAMGRAAGMELTNTLQGMLGTIAAFGNITGGRATTFDWADRLAEWSTRYLDPGLALPGPGGITYGQPSKYQRSLFTNTARIRGFQVDIDSKGNATAVRDNNGYIVGDEDIRNDIIAEYEAAPDKYDVRYRPHLAPTLTTAAGGVMQVLITSRFAGLGRTAAAAKAIAAGQLTSRFAGQTYLQSLEEFGPENADIASRFAITTATLQSAVALYINPLELRLSPKSFAVTNTTLRKVASDLNRGLSKDAALRNGVRYYAADLARYMKAYGADVGKESLEGAFEKAIDIAGRRIVRSVTDINAEYDASLSSFIESMVSEGAGALFAAGGAIAQSNQWQQEQLMVAYESRDRILPMIKARYGEELVGRMQEVFDAADKRIVGVKTSREQKNQILLEEYQRVTKPSANEGTVATPPSESVIPSQSEQAIPQVPAEEVAVAAKPSIYDIVRDEAREMRLEEGDTFSFVEGGGIVYEVVSKEENDVTLRDMDTGIEYTLSISGVRAYLTNKYQDIIAREHPSTDPVRLAGLRRAASRTISDENVTLPRPSVTPVNMTEAQQPAVPATEPTTPTESIAQASNEKGVLKEGTQAPVFTMGNIEQAEGVDGKAIKTLLQSISQIAPGIKVRIHESAEELSAEAGFKARAYIIGDHTIVISKQSTLADITHEVVHPIMAATELKTPGVTERFFDEIMTKLPGDIAGEMEGFRSKYGEESEETQRDEVVTEFLARIASGRYDESILGNESIVDSMLRFFQSIFAKLGLTNPPTDVDSLRTFVKRIVPALQKGEVIELAGGVKGETKGVKARIDEFSLRNLLPQWFFKSADEDYKIENTKITLPESGKVFIDNELTGKQVEAMYANYRNKNFLYSVIDADKQISDNFIPDNYNVYHGTNKVDIDSNGNLILRPSENFAGKTTSVSFTQIPAVALDYASRKGGRYIVKIDNRAIKNYEVENHEEIAINTTQPVILPPGTFEVIKVYSFLDIKNLSEIDRIANKISKQSPYDIIDQYIQKSYQLTSSQEIAEYGDDNAKIEEGDMPDDYMSYELINREAAKKALSRIPDVNIVSAISDHLKETGEAFTSLGDLEGYNGVYGRIPFDAALEEFLGIKREDVLAIENAVKETIKARLTSSNMDVNYYRAKAWMKEEWGSPRATMEADAVAMFGITPAQAGIMYEVLSKSPDVKNFSRPPGMEVRKGVWGILDKVGQLRNEYLLSSKGMPREVQIAMEMANGEEAVLAQTTVKGYNRIKKLLSKYDKADRVKIKEIADRFIIGEATEAEILFLDKQLYYELLTIRSNLDEVTSAIMDEGSFSALRDEILAGNLGEYVNRAFRIHLSKNYTPDQAAIVAFRKEYKRLNGERITDELILEHMTKGIPPPTVDDIERIIQNNADNAMETMLEENRPGKGGKAQASAGKPTGIMKERKAFAGAGGKLADWINDNPAGSVPPADMVDAARQSFIGDRTREAIHKHPEHKAEINRAIKEGDKLIKLATKLGVAVPTGNPFSAEGIRNAVTSGNPITWTVPATVAPADAAKMQAHINKINDSITTVVDAIQDRAEDDLVTVMLGKNRIDGADGWRAQEHLLPGTRAILGEIPPLEAAVITMSKLANYYTVEKYYKLLKALGEGVFIFNANDIHIPVWATTPIGATGSERTSPLDGMKTAPEIAHILTQTEKFVGGVDLTVNWFQKINGFIQYNLTILSPRTQARNFLSNIWFVVRNWWSDPVRSTLAIGLVPVDLIAMKASQGRIRLTPKHDALRDMSDSLAAALYQNFGKGFSQYNKITAAEAGFGTTPDQVALFQESLRWMRPKMSDKSLNKADIIADAQATLGITSEQAHSLYSNLQPIGYNDYMGELVNKLAGAGLIGSSVSLRIIYDNIRQLNSPDKVAAFLTNSMLNDATNVADRAILLARKGLKLFESAYGMSDDTFKIFGYLQERAKYASALFGKKYFELSDEQKAEVDNKAIEVTKNIIPNYNRLGALAKSISKNIFIGNFIAFKIESMRTWYNHLALAQKEITDGINSGNGRMAQMGGARMAGLLAATATQLGIEAVVYGMAAKAVPAGFKWIGGAVGSLLKAATGGGSDDEDEERTEMMRLLSPSFSAYDYLVMTKEPEDGKFTTVSISANHPLGDFQRASNYALLGIQKHDPWSQVAFFTALQLMGNLADTKILVQILSETSSGEDSYGGRIWDETDSADEKIKKSVQYAIKKAGPGITGQLSRLGWMDWVPSNEAFGWLHKPAHAGTAAEEAFGMATGFRPIVVDAYRVFKESIDNYVPGFGESGLQSSIFNDAQPNNANISNAVFEEQIKGMVEKEWRFLRNLHRIYYLTTKYDITEADKMQQIMADQGLSYDPSNVTGRPFQIIATGKYSLPWNQIRKVEGRRMQNEKLKEPYQGISRELEAWLMEYEREVNQ